VDGRLAMREVIAQESGMRVLINFNGRRQRRFIVGAPLLTGSLLESSLGARVMPARKNKRPESSKRGNGAISNVPTWSRLLRC
jgi:hypothetical protein